MIIVSCNPQSRNTENNSLLTKTIVFPDSLLMLNGTHFQKIDSFLVETKNKNKIISIIDVNCVKCIILQLNKIDSIFNSIIRNDNSIMVFVLNLNKGDSTHFMRDLQPIIKAKGILLWDSAYHFELVNDLLTNDLNERIFMLNKENIIVQYGNPIINTEVISEYKKKLR